MLRNLKFICPPDDSEAQTTLQKQNSIENLNDTPNKANLID